MKHFSSLPVVLGGTLSDRAFPLSLGGPAKKNKLKVSYD
jgi:hypothetical protein